MYFTICITRACISLSVLLGRVSPLGCAPGAPGVTADEFEALDDESNCATTDDSTDEFEDLGNETNDGTGFNDDITVDDCDCDYGPDNAYVKLFGTGFVC